MLELCARLVVDIRSISENKTLKKIRVSPPGPYNPVE
jgi:hypothetical protein